MSTSRCSEFVTSLIGTATTILSPAGTSGLVAPPTATRQLPDPVTDPVVK